jgi:hypothetical protein
MARKRRPVDPGIAERLFGDRLKRYLGQLPAATNTALGPLLGEPASPDPAVAPLVPAAVRVERWRHLYQTPRAWGRSESGPDPRKKTVYLSARDLDDADHIAAQWSRAWQRHVSRSEVVRLAIRGLRATLDNRPAGT